MRANHTNRRPRVLRKLTGIATAAALALSVLGGGAVTAKAPSNLTWVPGYGTDSSLPQAQQPTSGASTSAVSAGKKVGFFEWLRNDGASNISQLYVTVADTYSADLAYARWEIKDSSGTFIRGEACPLVKPLSCSNIGALNSTQTVYLIVAFTIPLGVADGSIEQVTLNWSATGTPAGTNQSHGDDVIATDEVRVTNNGDAAGDFNIGATGITVQDEQKLSGKNRQATIATVNSALTGVAVGDSPSLSIPCNSVLAPGFLCSSLTSLVSTIEVGNGKSFTNASGGPGIKVIVSFTQAPNQLNGSAPFAYHYYLDELGVGQAEVITESCTYDPESNLPTNEGPCLTVGNRQVTVWLTHNGGIRM